MDRNTENNRYTIVRYRGIGIFYQKTGDPPGYQLHCVQIRKELRELYGLTETEARNILFERNVSDYVNKYDRIRNLIPIPLGVGNSAYNDEMIMQCVAI